MKIEHSKPRKILLPSEGETVAISSKRKTAALCYDRVLVPDLPPPIVVIDIPDSIRCCGESPVETDLLKMWECFEKLDAFFPLNRDVEKYKEVCSLAKKYSQNLNALCQILFPNLTISKETDFDAIFKEAKANPLRHVLHMNREIAKSFSERYGIPVSVVCASIKERAKLYKEGNLELVASVLSNLEIVDEEKITWQQVLEFRKDKRSLQKYRNLLHWLDKEMIGKSQAFIEDDIAQKLEDYESTLKKHGLKTVLGTIEEVLDGKYLLGASGVVGSFSIAGYPGLGVLAGTGLIVGKMAVKLGNTWLDFDDAERGANSEISWVYEVKEQVGK